MDINTEEHNFPAVPSPVSWASRRRASCSDSTSLDIVFRDKHQDFSAMRIRLSARRKERRNAGMPTSVGRTLKRSPDLAKALPACTTIHITLHCLTGLKKLSGLASLCTNHGIISAQRCARPVRLPHGVRRCQDKGLEQFSGNLRG